MPTEPKAEAQTDVAVEETTDLLGGRYRLESVIGKGGQGETWLATDTKLNSRVAIKTFTFEAAEGWKEFELFQRECRILHELNHHAIPKYLEELEAPDQSAFYLVMEYVPGETLAQAREKRGPFDEATVWNVLWQVLDVLSYLHDREPNVVHRDIKPGNLIRRPDGTISIVDFGAVRDFFRVEGGSTVVGTFGYMAPEQLAGQATPATDMFALGATLVSLSTGEEPENIKRKGLRMDLRAHLDCSPELMKVLTSLLEPEPDKRPQSASALLEQLKNRKGSKRRRIPRPPKARRPQPAPTVRGNRREMTFLPTELPRPFRLVIGAGTVGIGSFALVTLLIIQMLLVPLLFAVLKAISTGKTEKERVQQNRARTAGVVAQVRNGASDLTSMGTNEVRRALRGPPRGPRPHHRHRRHR